MTKEQVGYYVREVGQLTEEFNKKLAQIASNARGAMLGYFAEHRLTFFVLAGGEEWQIEDTRKSGPARYLRDDDLPTEIAELLSIEIANGDYLGLHIAPINSIHWSDRARKE